jgi:hypothetical protein
MLFSDLYDGNHYPTFSEMLFDENLFEEMKKEYKIATRRKIEENSSCLRCKWDYNSEADKKRHNDFCTK